MGEFELIRRYFARDRVAREGVRLGIGDDCALIDAGGTLAVSTDMLVEGRHFFRDADPEALGHKALAVNLSDLAAVGAQPFAFSLALALPAERANDAGWMEAFARGLFALADRQACELVGGDTTAGPLNICITVFGRTDARRALRRSGARTGDDVWVSGALGAAAFAVDSLASGMPIDAEVRTALERPEPRVALGRALTGIATSAIDLSDGLAGDLTHVLVASGVGAEIEIDRVPFAGALSVLPAIRRLQTGLGGGDDYELCFTAPSDRVARVEAASRAAGVPVTRIGRIVRGERIVWHEFGQPVDLELRGFDHFANEVGATFDPAVTVSTDGRA